MVEKEGPNKVVMVIALCWLVFVTAFMAGLYVYAAQVWPYPIVAKIQQFVAGDTEEKATLMEKVKNDLNFKPARHIISSSRESVDFQKYKELTGLPLHSRRDNPKMYLSPAAPKGYRLIYGGFDFEDNFHGAILLDQQGKVSHVWQISQEGVEWNHRPDTNTFPHGFEIAPDGSIVTAYDGGTSLTRYGYCGEIIWRIKGGFHHSIAFDSDGSLWTWGKAGAEIPYGDNLIKIDFETGKILKEFHLNKVMKANPDIDIFGILQEDSAEGSNWISDEAGGRWHANDIDPLPEELVQYYRDFKVGDLLVSLRSPDLVFVMDPETLQVKWWRQGLVRRQHDPDWNDQGTITIFNNNMHRGYSNIMELDPVTYDYNIMLDGEKYDFYTWMRGKHQLLDNGGLLVTSPQQGWVFEVDEQGEMTFEFLNTYGGEKEFMAVSEARFLPETFFKELATCK